MLARDALREQQLTGRRRIVRHVALTPLVHTLKTVSDLR
jgi:hypothetical protein